MRPRTKRLIARKAKPDPIISPMAGAFAGLRFLDLSRLLPGPYCSLLFADLGAEVIKVEEPGRGDYARRTPPFWGESDVGADFLLLNRNKKSMSIDLKAEAGKAVFRRLVGTADVLLESFRPGVMDRLGPRLGGAPGGEPAARLLRDLRLRPGRPVPEPRRPRRELHGLRGRPVGERARGRGAAHARGPGRRPRGRRPDGGVRHRRGPSPPARVRPGAVRRRLDDRRRRVLARSRTWRPTSRRGGCRSGAASG